MSIVAFAVAAAFVSAPCEIEGVAVDFEKQHDVECGWVSVPRGVGDETTIKLWVARAKAASPAGNDPILYINGGPGIATVDSVVPSLAASKTLNAMRAQHDIIFFDQRGSGRSEEALCPTLAEKLNAISSSGLSPPVEEERNRAAFKSCRAELEDAGIDLHAYTTANIVNDIEALRLTFKANKWNLLAVSYGTLVALHSMRTNPDTIRSAILNSPYPPNSVTWAEQASSAAAGYREIDRACSAEPDCRSRFGDLVAKLEATLARLEREPLKDGARTITGRQFAAALWPLAVRSSTVGFVPLAIHRAHAGDEAFIRKMVATFAGGDAFGGFSPAQAFAIACHEAGRTQEWYARAQALYPALVSAAPADSWDRSCADYRPGYADPSFFAPVASAIPTLIYAGSLDLATPVVDAYQSLRFLSNATLVEVVGAAHAPIGTDECTLGIALEFLRVPERGASTICLRNRKPAKFASDGLDELLIPTS